uniref:Nucleotide exchange factor Fes1 domain-containing protein n=1 Tax=Cyclophora tenuis TaxID=216820 RepID=A0A7S1D1P6_CYCTE
MKEGIIDENERMKEILKTLTEALETFRISKTAEKKDQPADVDVDVDVDVNVDLDQLEGMLLELRDIVEQIDYARAFGAMKGLPFLLGCVQERQSVPKTIRLACLGILATLCQNNPPLQMELLELGSIKILSDLFFIESSYNEDVDGTLRAKIVQAISANVRNHDMAEQVFCRVEQASSLLETALDASQQQQQQQQSPDVLRKRALFFLRALVTSDSATRQRLVTFSKCIDLIMTQHYLGADVNFEIRELSLELLNQILEQKRSVNTILGKQNYISQTATDRIQAIQVLTGEEREYASEELNLWEQLIAKLSTAERDEPETEESPTQTLLLTNSGSSQIPLPEELPQ